MNPLVIGLGASTMAAAVVGLIAAGDPDVTKARLEASLTPAYTSLYVQQAKILGHPGFTAATLAPSTVCDRGGPKVADVGPGADWICHVMFTDQAGRRQDGKFELNARSNGCYVATGPSRLNGPVMITDVHGRDVLNPVFEFDACYDPAASPAAGLSSPSRRPVSMADRPSPFGGREGRPPRPGAARGVLVHTDRNQNVTSRNPA